MKILLITTLFATALVSSVCAQISVTNTLTPVLQDNTASNGEGVIYTSPSFDLSGGNAVALIVTTEQGDTSTFSATFAGQALTAVNANEGNQTASIFYLIDPAITSGSFVFNTGPNTTFRFAVSGIALSNVGSLAGTDSNTSDLGGKRGEGIDQTTPLPVSYTTTTDGGYVIAAAVNNGFNEKTAPKTAGYPDQTMVSDAIGTSLHFSAHGDVPTAGSYTDNYYNLFQRTAVATLSFDSIPEFGSFGLLAGLSALSFIALRRRLAKA